MTLELNIYTGHWKPECSHRPLIIYSWLGQTMYRRLKLTFNYNKSALDNIYNKTVQPSKWACTFREISPSLPCHFAVGDKIIANRWYINNNLFLTQELTRELTDLQCAHNNKTVVARVSYWCRCSIASPIPSHHGA